MALPIERVVGEGELRSQPSEWQEIYLKASRDVNNASDLTQGQKDAAIGVLDRMACRLASIQPSNATEYALTSLVEQGKVIAHRIKAQARKERAHSVHIEPAVLRINPVTGFVSLRVYFEVDGKGREFWSEVL